VNVIENSIRLLTGRLTAELEAQTSEHLHLFDYVGGSDSVVKLIWIGLKQSPSRIDEV